MAGKRGAHRTPEEVLARQEWLWAFGVAALALACGANALRNGFVWDDAAMLVETAIRDPRGIADIWLNPETILSEGHYWPVTWTSLWLDQRLYGAWAPGWHATNLVLHAGVCVMVGRTLSMLGIRGAWIAAALFAVHPMHAEVIGWTMARKDALAALGALAAMQLWLVDDRQGRTSAWPSIALAFGLLAKSSAIAVVPAVLIVAWWRDGTIRRGQLMRWAPMAVLGAAIVAADIARYTQVETFDLGYGLTTRIGHAGNVLATQIAVLTGVFAPTPIRGAYEAGPLANAFGWAVFWGFALATLAAWLARAKIGRAPAAVLACFGCALAPTLGLVEFSVLRFSLSADRFAYLANIAPLALAGAAAWKGLEALRRRKSANGERIAVAGIVIGLAALGALSAEHTRIYGDNIAFFRSAVAESPGNAGMSFNLAKALHDEGRFEESFAVAREASARHPKDARLAHFEGKSARKTGRHEAAVRAYRQALALEPHRAISHLGLGYALEALGRHAQAVGAFTEAARHSAQIRAAIGATIARAQLASGNVEGAIRSYREGVRQRPNDPLLHVNLASVLIATRGDTPEARRHLERAQTLAPDMGLVRELLKEISGTDP